MNVLILVGHVVLMKSVQKGSVRQWKWITVVVHLQKKRICVLFKNARKIQIVEQEPFVWMQVFSVELPAYASLLFVHNTVSVVDLMDAVLWCMMV
jgi:hypothetical protein